MTNALITIINRETREEHLMEKDLLSYSEWLERAIKRGYTMFTVGMHLDLIGTENERNDFRVYFG